MVDVHRDSPRSATIQAPDQFYTNGVQVDGWTHDEVQQQMVSFWFGKSPQGSLSYRQLVAIVKDNNPGQILYYDLVAPLCRSVQHGIGEVLVAAAPVPFGTAGGHPRVDVSAARQKTAGRRTLRSAQRRSASDEQLMMPPATMMFPRLRKSTWEGFYIDFGGNRRQMTLSLNETRGEYRRARWTYEATDRRSIHVTGRHDDHSRKLGRGRQGNFEFRVMMSDLNEFQGEYWDQNGRRVGVWDAKRTSR